MQLNQLTTMLESADLRQTLRFYTETLGFTCQSAWPDPEKPEWICLRSGAIELMFCARNQHRWEFKATDQPLLTGSLYFRTNEVDALWARLKNRVAVEYPLENFAYGMREFAIRDCNGYLLQFGQGLGAPEPPDHTSPL